MTFEELHRPFVLLRRGERAERAEILTPAGLRILLPRVETVLAGGEFADHADAPRSRLLQAATKVLAPRRRQPVNRRGSPQRARRADVPHFQCEDVRHADAVGRPMREANLIATAHLACRDDGHVKARASARDKAFEHVFAAEANAELEARLTRLRHLKLGAADGNPVADANVFLEEAFDRQVLAEDAPGQ